MLIRSRAAVPGGLGAERSGARKRSGPRKGRKMADAEARANAEAEGLLADSPKKSVRVWESGCVENLFTVRSALS